MYIGKVTYGNNTWPVGSTLYGTCDTNAGTAAKVVTMPDFDTLIEGVTIHVKFTYSNSYHVGNATLNVNNTGAKTIMRYGTTAAGAGASASWNAGAVVSFTYDGTYWLMNDWLDTDTNTTYTFATGDSNGTFKVTPSGGTALNVSIKGLGDRAFDSTSYLPLSGGTMTGGIYWNDKGNTENEWNSYGRRDGLLMLNSTRTDSGAPPNYYSVGIHVGGSNYWYQLAFERGNQYLKYRGGNDDGETTNGWRTLLHDSNYSNYALPLTGGTLTGDLAISGNWSDDFGIHFNEGGSSSYGFDLIYGTNDKFRIARRNGSSTPTDIMRFNRSNSIVNIDGELNVNGLLSVNNSWLYANDIRTNGYLSFSAFHDANDAYGTGTCYMYFNQKQDLIRIDSVSNISIKGNKVWHEGNDGSGSGLDADLLDGWHSNRLTRIYNYTIASGKCVRITFGNGLSNANYAARIYVRRTNGGASLVLTGTGYGENAVRNSWLQISPTSDTFKWSVPAIDGIYCSVEISNTEGNSADVYVEEVTNVGVIFTEINSLTTTGVNTPPLHTGNTYVYGNKGYINGTEITNVNNVGGIGIANIVHAINGSGFGTSEATGISDSLTRTQFWRDNSKSGAGAIGVFVAHSTASTYGWEFYTGYAKDGDFYGRIKAGGTWGDKYTFITSANYTSYTVTKTGTGASGSWNINSATATKLATARSIFGQSFDGSADIGNICSNLHTLDFTGVPSNAGHGGIINFHYNGSSSVTSYIKETNGDRIDFHTIGGEGCGFVRIRNHGTGARIQGVVLNSGQEWAYNIARVTVAGNPYTNPTVVFGTDGTPCVIQSSDTYNKSAFWVENASYNNKLKLYIDQNYSRVDAIDSSNNPISIIRYGGGQTSANDDLLLGLCNRDVVIDGRNLRILCDEAEVMRVTKWGNCVGIGTTSPSYKLHVNGACAASSFPNTSDIRLKDVYSDWSPNIEDIAYAPSFLFKWKDGKDKNMHAGTSAQYWLSKAPELVTEAKDDIGTLSIQYDVLGTLSSITLAKEILELKKEIKRLQALIAEIKLLQNN